MSRKKKGKGKEGEDDETVKQKDESLKQRLATLDLFSGCGGLSEGLEQAGSSNAHYSFLFAIRTYLPDCTCALHFVCAYRRYSLLVNNIH